MEMNTSLLIGEGSYRFCYSTQNPDLCVKKMKPIIRKRYLGFDFDFDMRRYLRMKFGISDINKIEFNNLSKLPEELNPYIPTAIELNAEGLYMERPKDYNGEYSKSILEIGIIENDLFWISIEDICTIFDEYQMWFNDVFFMGNNLLVKKLSKDEFIPVMIDLKEIGRNLSPIQFNLILKSEQRKKFYRRFRQFEKEFRP